MNLYDFIDKLSDLAKEDDIIIPSSSGMASEITQQAWKVKKGQRIICNPGLGSMGFALPHAIGACIASGKKRTICIEGDGSLQHNVQELHTISRLNLPIHIFILCNKGYASIRNTHKKYFNNDPVNNLKIEEINLKKLAKAYNISYTYLFQKIRICFTYPYIYEIDIDADQERINGI